LHKRGPGMIDGKNGFGAETQYVQRQKRGE